MTAWDVVNKFIEKGLSWTLLIGAIVVIPPTNSKGVEYTDNNVDCGVCTQEEKKSF